MIIYDHIGHMVSTTSEAELHNFAKSIGLKRSWYQWSEFTPRSKHNRYHRHYDLTTYRMMNKARKHGALMVTPKELIKTAWWAKA